MDRSLLDRGREYVAGGPVRPDRVTVKPEVDISSQISWLTQITSLLLQPTHSESEGLLKIHFVFRRLHSRQLWVPLRSFRLRVVVEGSFAPLGSWSAVIGSLAKLKVTRKSRNR